MENKFLGRSTEVKFLNQKYETNGAMLGVLYGRRRIGKSELLKSFGRDKPFFPSTESRLQKLNTALGSTIESALLCAGPVSKKLRASRYFGIITELKL